jgi:hypothetical protein
MATTTSITTSYAGESAGKYIAAALLSAPTISKNLITVKPNIKYKQVVKTLSTDDILKNATCDFSATSTVTIAERVLQPEEFQVNLELCKQDFVSDWSSIEMGYSAFDQLPKSFADFLLAHVAEKVAAKNETNIWTGVNSNAGEFAGFATLIAADAALPSAQEVGGTTVTAANVVAELGKIVDALPSRLYGKEGLILYVSQNIYKAYVRALGGFAASGVGANGTNNQGTQWYSMGSGLSFDGIPVEMVNGLAANTAMLTLKENLWFGTGLLSDHNEVKILDMSEIDGSQNCRVIMRLTAGVQYGFAGDIVTYGITNSAN